MAWVGLMITQDTVYLKYFSKITWQSFKEYGKHIKPEMDLGKRQIVKKSKIFIFHENRLHSLLCMYHHFNLYCIMFMNPSGSWLKYQGYLIPLFAP